MSVRDAFRAAAASALSATVLAAGAAAAGSSPSAGPRAADGPAPSWAEAFATDPRAGDVHAVARYLGGDGAWHRLALWRRGDVAVHRVTDDRLDVHVTRDEQAAGQFRYRVRDARRGTWIEVDRANLFRIGIFSDWASLAHLLREPGVPVTLTRLPATAPSAGCDTLRVAPAGGAAGPVDEVCWSARWGLPLRVTRQDADGRATLVLEVLQVEAARADDPGLDPPVPSPDEGFVDANADIDPAAD